MMIDWKRNLFFVWLSQILSLAGFGSVIPFIPLYMRNVLGVMDDGERGLWVSAFYFGGQLSFCISMPIWGTLADRFGRRVMLLRANLVTALLFPLMAYVPNVFCLVLIRFVISIFSGTVNAAQTLVGSTTPEELAPSAFLQTLRGFIRSEEKRGELGMTTLYIIRHGETAGNDAGRFQGSTDCELNERGYAQAERLGERCRDLPFEVLISSPLVRARETASAANRYHGLPLRIDADLAEMHCGDWEGKSWEELRAEYVEEMALWREKPWLFRSPGGETMQQVYDRVSRALDDITGGEG